MSSTVMTNPRGYRVRVMLWELRRRRLALRLRRQHALPYEVMDALHRDALTHPHPTG